MRSSSLIAALAVAGMAAAPAAAQKETPTLVTCEESLGTVALVEGDTQGWSEFGLGSPRPLLDSLVQQSGCFTVYQPGMNGNADFLMNMVAGSQEEVDQSVEIAKSAASEALIRSGAAGSMLGNVPIAGSLLGAFGMFGGKKKTVAAAIKIVNPSNGTVAALGSGSVKKSSLSFGGSNAWSTGAAAAGYDSKNGKMLTEAFILAFNQVVSQKAALAAVSPASGGSAAPASSSDAVVAVDTQMRAGPAKSAAAVRSLRKGTTLSATGKREGLFVEMSDGFGTTGWVSVEDLN